MTTEGSSNLDSNSDQDLLRRYAKQRSQAAFSQIVRRHYALVYATCKREVGDAELAKDVSQVVFMLLARKAPLLRGGTGLAGWLFQTACFASKNAMRQERRRQQREAKEQAVFQHQHAAGAHPSLNSWEGVEPHLNDALARLKPGDREAVLLRFFESHSLAEVGARLGVSENTARMRITRALERMRRHLTHQGVTVGAALLAGLLTEKAHAAPLAPSSFALFPGGLSLGGGTVQVYQLMQGVLRTMRMKTAMGLAATVAAAAIIAFPLTAASISRSRAMATAMKISGQSLIGASPAAKGVGSPLSLKQKVTAHFTLGKDEHAYYSVSLPKGTSLIVVDTRRTDGKWGDDNSENVTGVLSYLDKSGHPVQGNTLNYHSTITWSFQQVGTRFVDRQNLQKPATIILDIHNKGIKCDYWLTTFLNAPAVPTSPPVASPALAVPLFGQIVPKPMTLDEEQTGRLAKNGYAYFAIPLQAGRYKATLTFSSVSGKTTDLNGDLILDDENGMTPEGVGMMEITDIHWTDSPYSNTSKFTLKRGGVFLIKVSNQGGSSNEVDNDAVNFTAKIMPDTPDGVGQSSPNSAR